MSGGQPCIPRWARLRCCGLRTGETLLLLTALVGLGLYAALLGEALRASIEDPGGLCDGDAALGYELAIWLIVDGAVGTSMALVIVGLAVGYLNGVDFARVRRTCLLRVSVALGVGIAFLFCWSAYGNVIVWEEGLNGRFRRCDLLARVLSEVVMYFQMAAICVIGAVVAYAFRRPILLRCVFCPCCSRGSDPNSVEVAVGGAQGSRKNPVRNALRSPV